MAQAGAAARLQALVAAGRAMDVLHCDGLGPGVRLLKGSSTSPAVQRAVLGVWTRLARGGAAAAIADSPCLQLLVSCLASSRNMHVQAAVLRALRALCFGSPKNARHLVAAGGVPLLVRLLRCGGDGRTLEQAMRLLTQLAADGAALRPAIEVAGGIQVAVGLHAADCADCGITPIPACRMLPALAKGGPATCLAVQAAGGVGELVRVVSEEGPAQRTAAGGALLGWQPAAAPCQRYRPQSARA